MLNTTSLTTSVNVTGLIRKVEYNVTVFGVNNIIGNKASLLMMLDGKYNAHYYFLFQLLL